MSHDAVTIADGTYVGARHLEAMRQARNYNTALADMVTMLMGDATTVLDIGAGNGEFAVRMRDAQHLVSCVEPDHALRRSILDQGFSAADHVAAFPEGHFDAAYSLNVLEHIEDDVGALKAWSRAIKPGGLMVIYVPAFSVLYGPMDRAVGHYRRYTRKSLSSALTAAGLDVLLSSYFDCLGFPAALLAKLMNKGETLSPRVVRLYDRLVFPISRSLDLFVDPWIGKNVWAVARKPKKTNTGLHNG